MITAITLLRLQRWKLAHIIFLILHSNLCPHIAGLIENLVHITYLLLGGSLLLIPSGGMTRNPAGPDRFPCLEKRSDLKLATQGGLPSFAARGHGDAAKLNRTPIQRRSARSIYPRSCRCRCSQTEGTKAVRQSLKQQEILNIAHGQYSGKSFHCLRSNRPGTQRTTFPTLIRCLGASSFNLTVTETRSQSIGSDWITEIQTKSSHKSCGKGREFEKLKTHESHPG